MKKLIQILMIFTALTLILTGCAQKTDKTKFTDQPANTTVEQTQPENINLNDMHIDFGVDGVEVQQVK